MRYLVIVLLASLLLFGCSQNLPPTTSNETITENTNTTMLENKTTITIKNSTYEEPNPRNPDTPPEPNASPTAGYYETPEDKFAIYFINVGMDELQGDAILIKKGDFDMLVDTGNTRSFNTVVNFLKARGVDDLEVLVSTHADSEHYSGIETVAEEFDIEEFWWTGKLYGDTKYDALIRKLNDKNIPIKEVVRGDKRLFNGISVQVLNPRATKGFGDRDNDGIALKITQEQFCLLLTSDLLGGAQSDLANDPALTVRCNLMQMPGHGLGRATTTIGPFLLKVAPNQVIFSGSVSDPSADKKGTRYIVYEKLNTSKIKYYENYKNGTVRITSDGLTYVIDYLSE